MAYKRFEVVKVPFPFTDRHASKIRPALILSELACFSAVIGHSVLAMITSAKHSAWPLDTPVSDLAAAGLPAPSIVRMKLFTLDHRLIIARLGKLAPTDRVAVDQVLKGLFGLNK